MNSSCNENDLKVHQLRYWLEKYYPTIKQELLHNRYQLKLLRSRLWKIAP
ncbi:hypothetical protein [Anaerobacillus arseniciselenatis]